MNRTMLGIGSVVLIGGMAGLQPALAQTGTQQTPTTDAAGATTTAGTVAGTAPAGTPQVTVGAAVNDTTGAQVGTISAVGSGTATVDTGTVKAAIPTTSFGKGSSGLVIAMTKAQLEAAVAQAKPTIAVGNAVVGPQGNAIGSVTAVDGDLVTVQTKTGKVRLPSNAFAQKTAGTLVIGLTPAQLDAAAKAASAPPGK